MKVSLFPMGAVLAALALFAAGGEAARGGSRILLFAGSGSAVLALAAAGSWHILAPKGRPGALPNSLRAAMPEWRAGRRASLEALVAQFAGPVATAHAVRCATLADMLIDHLAMAPEEAVDLPLAALLHVLPAAYPESEDARPDSCAFSREALERAAQTLARIAPPAVARMAGEASERWDGNGLPAGLVGEAASMGGRVIATACAFDHAAKTSLDAGLEAVRAGSSSRFDPVVAGELIHLFREPWQLRVAA